MSSPEILPPDGVMLAPMEPVVPCRHMDTRPCVIIPPHPWTAESRSEYPAQECPPGACARFPHRE